MILQVKACHCKDPPKKTTSIMECHKTFERCSRLFQNPSFLRKMRKTVLMAIRWFLKAPRKLAWQIRIPAEQTRVHMNLRIFPWVFQRAFFFLISGVVSPPNFHRISCVYKFLCWFFGCFPPFRRRIWGFFEQKNQGDGPGRFDIFTKLAAVACQSSCLKSCWHKTPQPMGR